MKDSLRILILKRLAFGLLTLFVISVLITLGVEMLPGDLAQAILGQHATTEALAAIRLELGLDRPLHVRYFVWLGDIVQWDLGTSLVNNREVADLIGTPVQYAVSGIVRCHYRRPDFNCSGYVGGAVSRISVRQDNHHDHPYDNLGT